MLVSAAVPETLGLAGRWEGKGPTGWCLCCGLGGREAGGAQGTGPSTRLQGLFDNFLRLRLRDSSLAAVCIALDWLAFDDLLSRAAHHGQSFQLLRYLPFLPPAFHLLFASSHVPRITFPSSQQEVRPTPCPHPGSNTGALGDLVLVCPPPQAQNRMSRTHNLMQTLVSGITPATRSRAAPQALILDTLCLLLDILAPKLRPVSALPGRAVAPGGGRPLATLSTPACCPLSHR